MRKVLAAVLACSFLMLGSCRSLGSIKVHGPPQYSEEGVPSDLYYEELAAETQDMAPPDLIPADPEEALRVAEQQIADHGIEIVPKAEGIEQWEKFTTTFPTKIFVSKGWEEKSVASKAEILWHELVHVREYDRHTPLLMGLMYVTSEGRWALEVQAYRESYRVQRLFGVSEEDIRRQMEPRAVALYESYELGTMPRDYAVGKAVEIWMLDSR
jgi:hypothetical protein